MRGFSRFEIINPKRESEVHTGRASWYPYYAGFSETFANRVIRSARMKADSIISDPWNGSGTTTAAAAGAGHDAFGCDLNPVMVLVARARMLSKREKNSLVPLGSTIVKAARHLSAEDDEPLETWFLPRSASAIRAIERGVQRTLISNGDSLKVIDGESVGQVSDLTAFFYVALFRASRRLIRRFTSTNPTWIKKPSSVFARARPSVEEVEQAFKNEVKTMTDAIPADPLSKDSDVRVLLGSSDKLPLADESVDMVLSSPPYCTRIDYAVATYIELALLGFHKDRHFDQLRRRLIGSTTVPSIAPHRQEKWGKICLAFLDQVEAHSSKASATYYLKNHLQYFEGIYRSLGEISRTLKHGGRCVMVVQDSHYKDIHNDLPAIIAEMSANQDLELSRTVRFRHEHTMASANPSVRKYRKSSDAVESVMCFSKN